MKRSLQILQLLLTLSLFLSLPGKVGAVDFVWKAGTVSARVKVDQFRPEMGQYLYITHDEDGAEKWNMAKLNLPESWKIASVTVDGLSIHVAIENGGHFTVTPANLGKLRSELIKADKALGDGRLAEIWRRLAVSTAPQR
jgi:hypothetical protein